MTDDQLTEVMTALCDDLLKKCFSRWRLNPLGPTLRQHCVAYFAPEKLAEDAIRNNSEMSEQAAMAAVDLYRHCVLSNQILFESYGDQQVEEIYAEWQRAEAVQNGFGQTGVGAKLAFRRSE